MRISQMSRLIYKELSYQVNGLLFNVHNERGRYCNEKQYCDAIEQKLREAGIHYEREKALPPSFAGEELGRNKIDFLIEGKIVVEVKVKRVISREDYYQTQRYLRALNKKLALLINFRNRKLNIKRILNSSAGE